MFPNPQNALPLPLRPNLERYKKLAKDLVKACRSSDKEAIGDWAEQWVNRLVKRSGIKLTRQLPVAIQSWVDQVEVFAQRKLSTEEAGAARCRPADAQFVIARSHGFKSWPQFCKHLDALKQKSSSIAGFEAAADTIISGDVITQNKCRQPTECGDGMSREWSW